MDIDSSKQAMINALTQRVEQLEEVLQSILPPAMAYYSEELFAAGWLTGLEKELPQHVASIDKAATLLGMIPTSWDYKEENSIWNTIWKKYPITSTKTDDV